MTGRPDMTSVDESRLGVAQGSSAPLLAMEGIRKTFGPVVALDGVDLTVGRSEVHGLLGGNGAGKTTLMNVLYGLYRPDSGSVVLDGSTVDIRDPRDAISHGVGMVHQNFLQVDTYTVTENIVLGTSLPSWPTVDLKAPATRIAELSERFGLTVDPHAEVARLSVGLRQRVEILKALYRGAKVLVLDEPTTNLTPQEVDSLFGSLRAIVDEGMSVVFITHKIRETMAVCDALTVMRDGKRVGTVRRADTSAADLATLMVGDDAAVGRVTEVVTAGMGAPSDAVPADAPVPVPIADTRDLTGALVRVTVRDLVVHNDHGVAATHDVGFEIRRGEIVGIAGVAGNGQVELAEGVAGVRALHSGAVEVDGEPLAGRPTAVWLESGVAYVPEDRHRDGILPSASIMENLVLGAQRSVRFRKGPLVDWKAARRHAEEAIKTYSIKASGPTAPAAALSGGNMQRVILARAFSHRPGFLILHNPTRGLDIPSTQFVYDRVREAAQEHSAVLLMSEDLDELTHLCDRILVLYSGRIVGERQRGHYDQYELGHLMAGLEDKA
ncbi:ABC transporter ATP-binding protein [Knoellia sp. p5-6-4]|uniref:ABC transporter ATP-binding protein n=1 Tax=unclassified Knoellia TaxID=2618719 RepID=UPI0023DCE1D1|nr:ABC transporter ATP-binding protein [Knoellia sp. p5-6-4]MDF2146611.1 ABC transporter ATP-binding protein [Knoellia sp. p5-6-4]